MTRLTAAVAPMMVVLAACSGGVAETTEAAVSPATTTAPPTTVPPATTSVSTTTATTESVADNEVALDCSALEDQTVALWQGFFAALGTMSAADLGSERWIEIDATHAIPLETHGIETEAAGCGGARLMLCDRLDELEPGGGLAEFFLGIVVGECGG